jgi:hypothetical protein
VRSTVSRRERPRRSPRAPRRATSALSGRRARPGPAPAGGTPRRSPRPRAPAAPSSPGCSRRSCSPRRDARSPGWPGGPRVTSLPSARAVCRRTWVGTSRMPATALISRTHPQTVVGSAGPPKRPGTTNSPRRGVASRYSRTTRCVAGGPRGPQSRTRRPRTPVPPPSESAAATRTGCAASEWVADAIERSETTPRDRYRTPLSPQRQIRKYRVLHAWSVHSPAKYASSDPYSTLEQNLGAIGLAPCAPCSRRH